MLRRTRPLLIALVVLAVLAAAAILRQPTFLGGSSASSEPPPATPVPVDQLQISQTGRLLEVNLEAGSGSLTLHLPEALGATGVEFGRVAGATTIEVSAREGRRWFPLAELTEPGSVALVAGTEYVRAAVPGGATTMAIELAPLTRNLMRSCARWEPDGGEVVSECLMIDVDSLPAAAVESTSGRTTEVSMEPVLPRQGPGGSQTWTLEVRAPEAASLLIELPPGPSILSTGRWSPAQDMTFRTSTDQGVSWNEPTSVEALQGARLELPESSTHILIRWPEGMATTIPLELSTGVSEEGVLEPCAVLTVGSETERSCALIETRWTGSIGDRIWLDTNFDGRQGLEETGVGGVELVLSDQEGVELARTRTDAQGAYRFTGLAPARYRLTVVVPEGLAPTFVKVGDPTLDSDLDRDGSPLTVSLGEGAELDGIDIGLVPLDTAPSP